MARPDDIRCLACRRLLARQEGGGVEVRDRRAHVKLIRGAVELRCVCGAALTVELERAPHQLRVLATL